MSEYRIECCKERVIIIKKYYFHYNDKDVGSLLPLKKPAHSFDQNKIQTYDLSTW
jgi:hypothetical protein